MREGRLAFALEPEDRNAYFGAFRSANLALVCAPVGEKEKAIALIERLQIRASVVQLPDCPHSLTLADLRLRWE